MEELFTQKWAIISLLEEKEEGHRFNHTDTPLHVTLAGVFAVELSGNLLAESMSDAMRGQPSIEVTAERRALFGPGKDISVTALCISDEVMQLHDRVYSWLGELGVVYNSPEYQGKGFLPHVTDQKSSILNVGDTCLLQSVSLIDLFPDGNGYERRIVSTTKLQAS